MPALPIDQQVTFFYTRNLTLTDRFYRQALQLPLILDQGACRIYRVCRDGFIGFCRRDDAPATPADPGARHVIFTLVTPAVDDWFRHLRAWGATIEKPPAHNPNYNIYHCFVRDPNGYLIEIQTFLDPAWPAPPHESSASN
ncbi:MAG: VOC family protein [Anaerolineae bacterium]